LWKSWLFCRCWWLKCAPRRWCEQLSQSCW
jgi:hypothetical protein